MPNYLEELTVRLAVRLAALPDEQRAPHAAYLLSAQRPDGGFAGRDGDSDLYYTSFALRSLALLGELHGPLAAKSGEFLRGRLAGNVPIIDFMSLIYAAKLLEAADGVDVFAGRGPNWREAVGRALEALRRSDGGYAKTAEGQASSVYHSFLVLICRQLLGLPVEQPERLVEFVLKRRRDDGGFVEMSPMKRSGTNPTAAAVGMLRMLDALDDSTRAGTIDFLLDMQTDEGGLRANTRIPIADLLSTCTGLITLGDLNALGEIDLAAVSRYAESLQAPGGGFHGAAWDGGHDVEYTFYGLASLALTSGT